jgi:hypothetical protein
MDLTIEICSLFTIFFFTSHNILGNRVNSNRKRERIARTEEKRRENKIKIKKRDEMRKGEYEE